MRWPGRALEAGEVPPAPVLAYVAQQLGVAPAAFADYAHRDQTRREHLVEIRRSHGFRIFDRNAFREVVAFSVPIAQTIIHPGQMADVIVDELRRLQILLPSPSILEAVLRRARQQAEQLTYEVLTNGLLPDTLQGLDDLLARRPGQVATWLSWMRNAPQSPAARNILRLIERLAYIRALGLDRARADMIPALTFDRLADEGSRITPQHLGELNALRRHATLAATGIRLEESLTDATLTMFDKLLGSMARRAENRTRDKALKTVRELQGHLRTLTGSCRLLIDARSKGVDSLAQIEALDWQHFAVAVEQAEVLGRPETVDRTAELIERHRTVKLFVGAFLNAFEFRGAGAVQGLLSALAIIAELYRTGKRRLPDRVPLRFVPPAWRPFVLRDGIVDRAAYELCALSQLRERLRAGDIWDEASLFYMLIQFLFDRKSNPKALPTPELDAAFHEKAIATITALTSDIDDFGIEGLYDRASGKLAITDIAGAPNLAALPAILLQLYPGKLPIAYAVHDKDNPVDPIWTIITTNKLIVTHDRDRVAAELAKPRRGGPETGPRTIH